MHKIIFISLLVFKAYSQCSDNDPTYYAIDNVYLYQNKSKNSAIITEISKGQSVKVSNSYFGDFGWWEICYKDKIGWADKSLLSFKKSLIANKNQQENSTEYYGNVKETQHESSRSELMEYIDYVDKTYDQQFRDTQEGTRLLQAADNTSYSTYDDSNKIQSNQSNSLKRLDKDYYIKQSTTSVNNLRYQIFEKENFKIKCKASLKLDKLRMQQFKQQGLLDVSKPYHVYFDDTDYNINVSSFEKDLIGKNAYEVQKYHKDYLNYYQQKFDEMGVKNNRRTFKDYDAVFYENMNQGRLTKAVFFQYKSKSYMLQVTSSTEVETKFLEFINTFEIYIK